MKFRHVVVSFTVALLALMGTQVHAQQDEQLRYVAMGSSYAAGPGISPAAEDVGSAACGRSSANYAHLLANRRKLLLTDVSCGGATTANILERGQFGAPRQLDAVTLDTRLVTVTIGGNDVLYVATMGGLACQKQPGNPAEKPQKYCIPPSSETVEAAFATLEQRLRNVARGVHERAPAARLMFVDYISVVPPHGTCANLALTASEAARVSLMASHLNGIIANSARKERADYLPASVVGLGHDACSQSPWANGFTKPLPNGKFDKVPFHPNAEGMAAIAGAIDALLSNEPPPVKSKIHRGKVWK